MDSDPKMRITIDRASGGYRVHVWMVGSEELLFWSDIYASKQGAQRAAYHLKANAGTRRDRRSRDVRSLGLTVAGAPPIGVRAARHLGHMVSMHVPRGRAPKDRAVQ